MIADDRAKLIALAKSEAIEAYVSAKKAAMTAYSATMAVLAVYADLATVAKEEKN